MKKQYKHLQVSDRKSIYLLLCQGFSIQEIAVQLGCHKTTIYRELHRNSDSLD